jgi:hypothetical protein
MEAVTIRARVSSDHQLTWLEPLPTLREGEVEVTLCYRKNVSHRQARVAAVLPELDGKRYLGGTLRREEIYDDARQENIARPRWNRIRDSMQTNWILVLMAPKPFAPTTHYLNGFARRDGNPLRYPPVKYTSSARYRGRNSRAA